MADARNRKLDIERERGTRMARRIGDAVFQEVPVLDGVGRPLLDSNGKPVTMRVPKPTYGGKQHVHTDHRNSEG